MLLKQKRFLPIVMGSTIGAYLGKIIWLWVDYRKNPLLYDSYSAPWHTQITVVTAIAGILIFVELVLYILVCHRIKRQNQHSKIE